MMTFAVKDMGRDNGKLTIISRKSRTVAVTAIVMN